MASIVIPDAERIRQNMKKKIIYRKPCGKQDRFTISTTYLKTDNVRRSLELCKEMNLNMVNFDKVKENEAKVYACACDEIAIDGTFKQKEIVDCYEYAVEKAEVVNRARYKKIATKGQDFSPEMLRFEVYRAILGGAIGIEYQSVFGEGIMKDGTRGKMFRYIQDLNYRITQYGRTLMALKKVAVYCTKDVLENIPELAKNIRPISESHILAEQELPNGVVIGEFEDSKKNRYLMILNADYTGDMKAFSFQLKNDFRVYRVNPHDGKQMISKEKNDVQKILVMPGDAELLRYQNVEEEACFIEYALKK